MGRGRGRGSQAGTSGVQGRVYAITPKVESADQPVIQGTFLLTRLWARVLFDSGALLTIYTIKLQVQSQCSISTAQTQPQEAIHTHKSVYTPCPCIYR